MTKEDYRDKINKQYIEASKCLNDMRKRLEVFDCVGVDVSVSTPSELYSADIKQINLSTRVYKSIEQAGLETVGDLLDCLKSEWGLFRIRNFGEKSLAEVKSKILEKYPDIQGMYP